MKLGVGLESGSPIAPAPTGRLRLLIWGAVIAALAIAASNIRIASIPGVEWYLGPAFYLAATRRWGLWAGFAAALLSMAPTLSWWGHPFSLLIALGHVAVSHWLCRRTLLAPVTLGFGAFIQPLIAFPLLAAMHHAPTEAVLLVIGRKLLNDVSCAAIVDVLFVQFRIFEDGKVVQARREVRLLHFFRAWAHLGLLVILGTAFIGAVGDFRENFEYARSKQVSAASDAVRALAELPAPGAPVIVTDGYPGGRALAAASWADLRPADALKHLGCLTSFDQSEYRKSFDQIIDNCSVSMQGVRRNQPIYFLTSDREAAVRSYSGTLVEVAPIAGAALVLAVALVLLQRNIERNLSDWAKLLATFGREKLVLPPAVGFEEFAAPRAAFIAANNAHVASEALRSERRKDFKALHASMRLNLLRDITYDPAHGRIRCLELELGGAPRTRSIVVHPDDRALVQRALRREFTVEIRTVGRDTDWLTLYGRNRRADGTFERGLSFRLRQPRMAVSLMRQRARLQDMGLSVAATTHELQQPLFVISLSAEQGAMLTDDAATIDRGALRTLFDKILGQAHRAQTIVDRVARRAHAQQGEAAEEWVGVNQLLEDIVSDTQRHAERAGARLVLESTLEDATCVNADRTSLEQVLINGVRNAVDAIVARAKASPGPGCVRILSWLSDTGAVHMSIEDDGIGLTPQDSLRVFDAFYSTKPVGAGTGLGLFIARELVEEWGGRITLKPRSGGGSVLEFSIPPARVDA